jgi:hypothetical protein
MSGTINLDLYAKLVQGVEEATKKIYELLSAHSVEGLRRISPVGMSTIGVPDRLEGNTRMRRLSFEFAYEYTLVHVPTGGGVINTIAVTSSLSDNKGIEQENIQ